MYNMNKLPIWVLLSFILSSCVNLDKETQKEEAYAKPAVNIFKSFDGLDKIWYQGKAEVSRYELQQNRYRDVHPGEHIMIFVTEDFLTDKQVKNDNYTSSNSTPILKNNQLRKFTTGLYDYSIMTSVFTPTEVGEMPYTEKLTTSAQDWCGHAFMQVNKKDKEGYEMHLYSYFENEADQVKVVPDAPLEDELFNRIRMNPDALPTGKVQLYPSTVFARLSHQAFVPVLAEASLTPYTGSDVQGTNLSVYKVYYPSFKRSLEIVFEKQAPHRIEGWVESTPSMFDGKTRQTIARRTSTEWVDYWSKNSLEDRSLRDKMGIEGF